MTKRRTLAMPVCWAVSIAWAVASAPLARAAERSASLAGPWRFIRGGPALAEHPAALPPLTFAGTVQLPGTTDTNRAGPANDWPATYALTQPYGFVGTCWYERDVIVPDDWAGRRVTLLLERTKYTQCWLDGRPVGENAICCTPQEYVLGTGLSPGVHRLTVAVDNKRIPPVGADAHQFSGNTQGNWNGIIGRVELRATDPTRIDDVQVYPDAAGRRVRVRVSVATDRAGPGRGTLALDVDDVSPPAHRSVPVGWTAGGTTAEVELPLGPDAALWDEFHPVLHRLAVHLGGDGFDDAREVRFGLRTFAAAGRQFQLNGRPVFLRGKHDACVFPLTGHPPMDVDGWLAYLRTCQGYGLNHIRFHTWTPPEAAFAAADQLGFYLQPELPYWGTFDQHVRDALEPEAVRILRAFGNHPSFVMFSMGNEHWAGADVLASLVAELKGADPRHLYVRGTSAFSGDARPGPGDDYLVSSTVKTRADGPARSLRGANAGTPDAMSHVQFGPPDTLADYAASIAGAAWPTVTHEMGQYTVYPDYRQIAKYTGVARAHNLEHFRDALARAGMADQDQAFARASGALAALCYREEIESCLRTPDYGGFELLDLQDYPGQGTAPVGMLDAFMASKGIVTPGQWRTFCGPVVLLARFPKYAWTTDETFTAAVELAQYGDRDLDDASFTWSLADAAGRSVVASGRVGSGVAKRGNVRSLGTIAIPLGGIAAPAPLRLTLALAAAPVTTTYPVWVYPPHPRTEPPPDVTVARSFDRATEAALAAGRRVLLVCDGSKPLLHTVGGGFATDFWGVTFFHNKPGTMGLLCDPSAPALAGFPTEAHSDWQWFDIASRAQPLVLDGVVPPADRPTVQVIDNYERCHKLGLVFEAAVGPGRLLVCATDLLDAAAAAHPEAAQLLASLAAYAGSDRFRPTTPLDPAALRELFQTCLPMAGCTATASSHDPGWEGLTPARLIDGNDAKGWRADAAATGPCWCQVEFPHPTDLGAVEVVWADHPADYAVATECSADGTTWHPSTGQRIDVADPLHWRLSLDAKRVRFWRMRILKTPPGQPATVNEVRFLPITDAR